MKDQVDERIRGEKKGCFISSLCEGRKYMYVFTRGFPFAPTILPATILMNALYVK